MVLEDTASTVAIIHIAQLLERDETIIFNRVYFDVMLTGSEIPLWLKQVCSLQQSF